MKTVYKDLLFANLEFNNSSELIDFLSKHLVEKGKVTETFAEEVKKREVSFPTGLPTQPYGVAIPHTEQEFVHDTCLAFASLKNDIEFNSILGDGSVVNVRFVFLLASRDSDGHMTFMRNIMTAFRSSNIQEKLANAKTSEELYNVLSFIDDEDYVY